MEDYCTFEQAVALKNLGFDWRTETFWDDEGCRDNHDWVIKFYHDHPFVSNDEDCTILRPTLAQAQKWLRDAKRLEVNTAWDNLAEKWFWYINKMNLSIDHTTMDDGDFDTYEQALSAGIDQALELLLSERK